MIGFGYHTSSDGGVAYPCRKHGQGSNPWCDMFVYVDRSSMVRAAGCDPAGGSSILLGQPCRDHSSMVEHQLYTLATMVQFRLVLFASITQLVRVGES